MSGSEKPLHFPVLDFEIPPVPQMASAEYDRFLEETLHLDGADFPSARMQYTPVSAQFILVKEDGLVKNEKGGTQQ